MIICYKSGEACEKLRKVTAHCRALFDTLTDTLQDKVTLTKELQSIITPSAIILWLSTKAAVCCDLSKISDAYLFPTSACEIAENSDKSRENQSATANAFIVHGRVLIKLCRNKLSISYYERAIKIINEIYEEEYSKLRMAYNVLGKI